MTTFLEFRTGLHELVIPGIVRKYDHTPDSLSAADLYARFLRLPGSTQEGFPFTCSSIGNTKVMELVVAIAPAPLDTADVNFSDTITIMDNVEAALKTFKLFPKRTWEIRTSGQEGIQVGGIFFWGIIATVTGQG